MRVSKKIDYSKLVHQPYSLKIGSFADSLNPLSNFPSFLPGAVPESRFNLTATTMTVTTAAREFLWFATVHQAKATLDVKDDALLARRAESLVQTCHDCLTAKLGEFKDDVIWGV